MTSWTFTSSTKKTLEVHYLEPNNFIVTLYKIFKNIMKQLTLPNLHKVEYLLQFSSYFFIFFLSTISRVIHLKECVIVIIFSNHSYKSSLIFDRNLQNGVSWIPSTINIMGNHLFTFYLLLPSTHFLKFSSFTGEYWRYFQILAIESCCSSKPSFTIKFNMRA